MSIKLNIIKLILILTIGRVKNLENLEECGGEYSGFQYIITSPNYPNNYTENIDCIYTLRGSELDKCNQVFYLQLLNFSLRSSIDCKLDYLVIGDRNILCGNAVGIKTYHSNDDKLLLRFHSGNNGSDKGFKILVSTTPCLLIKTTTDNQNQNQTKYIPINKKINNKSKLNYSNISLYLFKPPPEINESPRFNIKSKDEGIIKPFTYFSLPVYNQSIFNSNRNSNQIISLSKRNKSELFKAQNFDVGVVQVPLPGFTSQVIKSDVIDNERENDEFDVKNNIDLINKFPEKCNHEFPSVKQRYLPSIDDVKPIQYPATTYGNPVQPLQPPPPFDSSFTPIENNYPAIPDIIPERVPNELPSFIPTPDVGNNFPERIPNQRPSGFIPTTDISNLFPDFNPNINNIQYRQCCRDYYSSRRILLASPGFPSLFYSGKPYECVYTVEQFSPNVCQLRFNFKFFEFGVKDEFCYNGGYIEIDGRRYCGCKTGFTLTLNAINFGRKYISVKYVGYPRIKFNGFLIEIIQEPCNNYPQSLIRKMDVGSIKFENFNNKIKINQTERGLIHRNKREVGYFYPKPEGNNFFNEENFVNIESISAINGCQVPFNYAAWTHAAKESIFRNARCSSNSGGGLIPNFPPTSPNYPPNPGSGGIYPPIFPPSPPPSINPSLPGNTLPPNRNCELITVIENIINSPRYPNLYPNNVNVCYRFIRAPGTCGLRLSILDFDVENSPGCFKDYLLFSNVATKYCGRFLSGNSNILQFPKNNIIDLRFVTDSYGSGRGFSIGFTQISC